MVQNQEMDQQIQEARAELLALKQAQEQAAPTVPKRERAIEEYKRQQAVRAQRAQSSAPATENKPVEVRVKKAPVKTPTKAQVKIDTVKATPQLTKQGTQPAGGNVDLKA